MFKKNEFKAALARTEITITDVAKALGIDTSTLSRKIAGQSNFYRDEIEKIRVLLNLDWNAIR